MTQRAIATALVPALGWLALGRTFAQELTVRTDDVECVPEGRFPEITACFEPASRLARARLYFRADRTPHWYFVEMRPRDPCHVGVLPRPKRSAERIVYYVEGLDKSFGVSRSEERSAAVKNRIECAAAALEKATVVVGALGGAPLVPAGFATASVGASVVVAGVAGAGAVVAGVVGGGGTSTTSTTTTTPSAGGTSTTTTPPSSTTTTVGSSTTLGSTTTIASTTTTPASSTTTTVVGCGDTRAPSSAITFPVNGLLVTLLVTIVASASDDIGVTGVEFLVDGAVISTDTSPPYAALWNTLTVPNGSHVLTARARDACGNTTLSNPVTVTVFNLLLASGSGSARLRWTSQLDVAGGSGQVVVNRTALAFVAVGTVSATVDVVQGEQVVEAWLVSGEGRPGVWRFVFDWPSGIRLAVRPIAGDVVQLTPTSASFRLQGRPGERIVFGLRTEPRDGLWYDPRHEERSP